MRWQDGKLICKTNDCVDTMLPQERDADMARRVAVAAQSNELQPDPKITTTAALDADEVAFIP